MSKLVKKQAAFLRLVKDTSSKTQRKALLDTATKEQLLALTEVTYNLLHGSLTLKGIHKKQLQRHKKFVRLLGNPRVGVRLKQKALCRQGGVVATILKVVEPFLKEVL